MTSVATPLPPGLSLSIYVLATTLATTGYYLAKACLGVIGKRRRKLLNVSNHPNLTLSNYSDGEGNVVVVLSVRNRAMHSPREYKIHCRPGEEIDLGVFTTPLHKVRDITHASIYDAEKDEHHPCTKEAQLICGPRGDFFGRDIPLHALKKGLTIHSGCLEYETSDGYKGGRRILGVTFTTKKKDTSAVRIMPEFLRGK